MQELFPKENQIFELPDNSILEYYPSFFSAENANLFFEKLYNEIPWQQDKITVFNKTHNQPRLTALFGNEGKPYTYSGITMQPHKWTPLLMFIKNEVENICNTHFTTVLLNLYRNGNDSMGYHADNERELGINPVIASVSFGAERIIHFQHNTNKSNKLKIALEHGSLLLMKGEIQNFYKHQIPKTTQQVGARINLTFRKIL